MYHLVYLVDMSNEGEVSAEFMKVLKDFVADILTTFPEYKTNIHAGLVDALKGEMTDNVKEVYTFVLQKLPPRFFDVVYQNAEIFTATEVTGRRRNRKTVPKYDVEFLPGINFRDMWSQELTDHTREVIWKYLQLLMFAIIPAVKNDGELFGESAKLFEAINEDELKNKLNDLVSQMENVFNIGEKSEEVQGGLDEMLNGEGAAKPNLPDVNELHSHLSKMMDGKIGKLAKEMAQETLTEFGLNIETATESDMKDVFQKLFKNPAKLMSMVKNIGSTLENKIKTGAVSESELANEAKELMSNMGNMDGMSGMMSSMMKGMMPNMGGNAKMNVGAMQSQMNRMFKQMGTKERMLKKLEEKRAKKAKQAEAKPMKSTKADKPKD